MSTVAIIILAIAVRDAGIRIARAITAAPEKDQL